MALLILFLLLVGLTLALTGLALLFLTCLASALALLILFLLLVGLTLATATLLLVFAVLLALPLAKRVLLVALLFTLATWLLALAFVLGKFHLTLNLLAQLVEPVGGKTHGVLVAANDLLGSILDRVTQLRNVLGQPPLNVAGFIGQIVAHQQRQLVE